MDGEIAEGGGDFTVVSLILFVVLLTVLRLVESVVITSDCAKATELITKNSNITFLNMLTSLIFSSIIKTYLGDTNVKFP